MDNKDRNHEEYGDYGNREACGPRNAGGMTDPYAHREKRGTELSCMADVYRIANDRGYANGLAVASLVMGILAIVTSFILIGFIFGSMGLAFALLSRGAGKMHSVAIGGLVCSIAGAALTFIIWIPMLLFGILMSATVYSGF